MENKQTSGRIENFSKIECIDEISQRLIQLEGILVSVAESSKKLPPRLIDACMWNANTLTLESLQNTKQLSKL